MQIPSVNSIECAILHDNFEPISGQQILDKIKRLAAKYYGSVDVKLMVSSTDKDIHVLVGKDRIMVSQNNQPLGPEGFRLALTTPYTGLVFPEARQMVERHRANTFVTVARGVLPDIPVSAKVFGDLMGAVDHLNNFTTSEEAEMAMKLCIDLSRFIVSQHKACAMHWCASDNLVSQETFERYTADGDPLMIGLRPFLSSSTGRLGKGEPLGMVANGSQWFLGKMILFEEAKVPLEWLLPMMHNFIKICRERGSVFGHNESFSVEGHDWTIGIYHEKIEGFDKWEQVRLSLVHGPQFGVYGDTSARRTFKYDSMDDIRERAEVEKREVRAANDLPPDAEGAYDPDNAMDDIIARKLRQREVDQENERNLMQFEASIQNQQPWKGSERRTSVAELRKLVPGGRRHDAPPAEGEEHAEPPQSVPEVNAGSSGGMLKRAFGFLGRR